MVHIDETVEVTPVPGGVGVGGVIVVPTPGDLEGGPVFERGGCSTAILDAQYGDSTSMTRHGEPHPGSG